LLLFSSVEALVPLTNGGDCILFDVNAGNEAWSRETVLVKADVGENKDCDKPSSETRKRRRATIVGMIAALPLAHQF